MSNALADIFAAVHLTLDGTGFEAQATALADKSGKNVGDTLNKRLNDSLRTGAGLAMGAAFGAVLNLSKELTDVTAKFTAQTGLAGKEAEQFADNLQALYATNVQGYTEIGDLLIGLQQHMALSGKAARDAATDFLDYARVAGGGAAKAIATFDELVDSGVISAAQMSEMMDKLVVAHQKFGVNIDDVTAALVKFAPAMTAFGISTDDALAYITMFSEMGLNAEVTTKAFNLALQKVKSPEELKRLIEDISNTEDPFLRAQKASDLFGKRAGVQLANALKPGSGGLDAWRVSAEEAAGATKKAGDALDSSFGSQATLMLHQFGGGLAEAAQNFGPLLMAASVMGPQITKVVMSGLGGLAAAIIPKIAEQLGLTLPTFMGMGAAQGAAAAGAEVATEGAGVAAGQAVVAAKAAPAAVAAGTTLGSAMGTAAGVALGGAIVLGVAMIAQTIKPALHDIGNEIHNAVFQSVGDSPPLADALPWPFGPKNTPDLSIAGIEHILGGDSVPKAAKNVATKTGAAIEAPIEAAGDATVKSVQETMRDVVKAVRDAKSALLSAWSDALDASLRAQQIGWEKMANLDEQAAIEAQIANTAKWEAMSKADRIAAREKLLTLKAEYWKLQVEDAQYGTNAEKQAKLSALLQSQAMKDGLASLDPDTRAMWDQVYIDTAKALYDLAVLTGQGGYAAAKAYADALARGSGGKIVFVGPVPGSPPPYVPPYLSYGKHEYASGGFVAHDQMAVVGEQGPEVVRLRGGSEVIPNNRLGGVTNVFNFPNYVGSKSELVAAIDKQLRLAGT
jgi:hypothetical protein